MVNKIYKYRKILIGISIFLALVFALSYFGIIPLSITGTEFGWIQMADSDDQLTNAVINSPVGCYTCVVSRSLTSKLWNTEENAQFKVSWTPIIPGSSDNSFIAETQIPYEGSHYIHFNPDLKNKHFALDINYVSPSGASLFIDDVGKRILSLGGTHSGRLELVPSIITPGLVNVYFAGNKVLDYQAGESIKLTFSSDGSSTITLSNPRYKPLFDCFVDTDEVLIFDEFKEGSTIDLSTLSYPVQKFCVNQPVVVRSFTDKGIATDTNNEVFLKLSEGGNIIVGSSESIRVPYITKSQTGLLRCSLSQAFNTQTEKCEDILSEGSDAPTGYLVKPIDIGTNEFSYYQNRLSLPLVIGSNIISPSKPFYTGTCNSKYTESQEPDSSYWGVNINGESINQGGSYNLNQFVKIDLININGFAVLGEMDGIAYSCSIPNDYWSNTFKISINSEGLKIAESEKLTETKLAETKSVRLNVNNQIADSNGGIKLITNNKIIDMTSENYILKHLILGNNIVEIPLKTDLVGDVSIEAIPYLNIDDKKVFGSNSLVINYKVQDTGINATTIYIDRNVTVFVQGEPIIKTVTITEKSYTKELIWISLGAIILLIIIIVAWRILR